MVTGVKLCTIWGAGFGSYSVKLANQSSFIHLERAVKKLLIEKEWVTYFLAYYLIGLRRNQAHSIFFNLFYNIRRIYYMNPEYMCNIVSFLPRDSALWRQIYEISVMGVNVRAYGRQGAQSPTWVNSKADLMVSPESVSLEFFKFLQTINRCWCKA